MTTPQPAALPDLTAVIAWLENGCDPSEAVKELKHYQSKQRALAALQSQPAAAGVSDELILKTLRPDVWMHVEGHHREQMLADARAILALRPQAVPMTPEPKAAPKLIGWRTSDYLMETADKSKADNWSVHHEMLPIFEGDPHTKLGLLGITAQGAQGGEAK